MVALSIMIEGQDGLTWPRWKRLIAEVESLGFAGLFRSDHFTNAGPPDKASLETIVSLTYLADHTQRIHFGTLVTPISFRHPTLLARQAAALDDLSNGPIMTQSNFFNTSGTVAKICQRNSYSPLVG